MGRRVLSLNGTDWWLGNAITPEEPCQASIDELACIDDWLPANVPGNVRADLIRAGLLPDVNFGMQSEDAQWVDDHVWWLLRRMDLNIAPTERVHLVLRGVDYISDVFVDEHHLGQHEGMFSAQIHEITKILRADSQLAVRILGSAWLPSDRSSRWEKVLNVLEARAGGLSGRYPQRRDTLKCQMSFGWDFSPALRTMGIWDDVLIIVSGGVFIRDLVARPQVTGETAFVSVDAELDAQVGQDVRLRGTLQGESFKCRPVVVEKSVDLPPGLSRQSLRIEVDSPHLWWTWDHGRPDLYRLTFEVLNGDRLLDSTSQCIGFRQVELEDWTIRLNGQRVYARGANWVPASILPGCVEAADYNALLKLARQANMNMLRVWGGGLREKRAFYDLCDRLGIAIWQEFPFACAFLTRYPRRPGYLARVEAEARAIVRDVRSHPSVILWCGGNEFSPRRNKALIATLSRALAKEEPFLPFLAASPSEGDSHNWQVWHRFRPPSDYHLDGARFASELGLQAPPGTASLRRFIPPDQLWPPGPSWSHHGAELRKLWRYARPLLTGGESTLESFILASQRAQAHGLQIAIEHFRRRKAQGHGGVLLWQLNEPWPAISWALLDFYRQGKLAFETVSRLFNPVLVSIQYPLERFQPEDRLEASMWIINDQALALTNCEVEVVLWDREGRAAKQHTARVAVPGDSAASYGHLSWELPQGGRWRLTCRLAQGEETISMNHYDLSIHDDIQPTLLQRLSAWVRSLVTPD